MTVRVRKVHNSAFLEAAGSGVHAANGGFVWAKSMGGTGNDQVSGIAVDGDGDEDVFISKLNQVQPTSAGGTTSFHDDDSGSPAAAAIGISAAVAIIVFWWRRSLGTSEGGGGDRKHGPRKRQENLHKEIPQGRSRLRFNRKLHGRIQRERWRHRQECRSLNSFRQSRPR